MDRYGLIRTAATMIPLLTAWALFQWTKPPSGKLTGALLGFLWCFATLPLLNLAAVRLGWWRFDAAGGLFLGQPVDLLIAWAVLWGVLPLWIPGRWPSLVWALVFFWLDLLFMPKLNPILQLGPGWIWGEAAAVLLVFFPGFYLGRWTAERRCLAGRSVLQFFTFAFLTMALVPLWLVEHSQGWDRLAAPASPWQWSYRCQILFLLALPGISAVQEFYERGQGTPFPFDPPQKMVSSGVYAYLANPMQSSMVLIYAAAAALWAFPWFLLGAATVFVYGSGLARWHEDGKLGLRYGPIWNQYRRGVKYWWPRWKPWVAENHSARIYYATTCSLCRPIGSWLLKRKPLGLEILPAEDFIGMDLTRLTYLDDAGAYRVHGLKAFARGLEHLNFAWTLVGACLRLPLISAGLQLILDALGGGPRRPLTPRSHRF